MPVKEARSFRSKIRVRGFSLKIFQNIHVPPSQPQRDKSTITQATMEDAKKAKIKIRTESSNASPASSEELEAAVDIGQDAFDGDPDGEIETILRDANSDPTALPMFSILAYEETVSKETTNDQEQPIGHVLFTAAKLDPNPLELQAAILAPLGVRSKFHKRGVGNALGQAGLNQLRDNNIDLCFVLGWPQYYPRFGFLPADPYGLETPFAEERHPEGAWMVLSLNPDKLDITKTFSKDKTTRVICCDALNQRKYWMAPDHA